MCGILFTNKIDISKQQFDLALQEMYHRGPDFQKTLLSTEEILKEKSVTGILNHL